MEWIITSDVFSAIRNTIGRRRPETGGILGSSDGVHIDHYFFDDCAECTTGSYTMNAKVLNEVIAEWNDNGVRFIGVIHSHPKGIVRPSREDVLTAKHIIETMDVEGKFFTPIVQVSPNLCGDIKIYPYTIEQNVKVKGQPLKIEKPKKKEDKAPNRFRKTESIFPDNLMAKKKVICVGCGGSRKFLETLARCGVGEFILFDGDAVEEENIATQDTYISEIGKMKTEVIRDRIHDINPTAKVTCINRYLDDSISDAEFKRLTALCDTPYEDTLLCGCTDNFFAQDRCARLAEEYRIPYLAAQIFPAGKGHEIIFTYPGLTKSCPACMLKSRYDEFANGKSNPRGSSEGAAVCVTDYLNAIKSYTALYILCYNEERTPYCRKLEKYADRNYLMTKCSEEMHAPALEPVEELERAEADLSFPFLTVAIGQTPEEDCPICKTERSVQS